MGSGTLTSCWSLLCRWGTGMLSVLGISFTVLPVAESTIGTLMSSEGKTFEQAYGQLLGTLCVTTLTPLILSFLPIR